MSKKSLDDGKNNKKDEFYTQLSDIENELCHYTQHFKDKIVLCNCDDPYESNFFKYFALHFNSLGLKKLIATGYLTSPIIGTELDLTSCEKDAESDLISYKETPVFKAKNTPYVAYINEVYDVNGDGRVDLEDVRILLKNKHNYRRWLKGEVIHDGNKKIVYLPGDFRSSECITLLKQADIVVTNPPFSLFREYVAQLVNYNKKFIIWGNMNAVTYKEIFPLIKENKMWFGFTVNATKIFQIPNSYEKWDEKVTAQKADGKKYSKNPSISVYTNLDINKRHEHLKLYKEYYSEDYPKYDNYDAINVDKVKDIPKDYDGVMGVPITFLDKFNPDQFEIKGMSASAGYNPEIVGIEFLGNKDARPLILGKNTYARIFIKRK